jgi:hypothetical protein
MYTAVCKLSDLGLHQVNSVGLHEDQTRNFQVKERKNNFDNAVNCQEYVVSLENEIWSNGVLIQRKTHVITRQPVPVPLLTAQTPHGSALD